MLIVLSANLLIGEHDLHSENIRCDGGHKRYKYQVWWWSQEIQISGVVVVTGDTNIRCDGGHRIYKYQVRWWSQEIQISGVMMVTGDTNIRCGGGHRRYKFQVWWWSQEIQISGVVVVTGDTNVGLSTLITEVIVSQSQRLLALTVALRLSGLIGTASHTDMQKIRIIGFFFENRLHWQFEVGKNFYKQLF